MHRKKAIVKSILFYLLILCKIQISYIVNGQTIDVEERRDTQSVRPDFDDVLMINPDNIVPPPSPTFSVSLVRFVYVSFSHGDRSICAPSFRRICALAHPGQLPQPTNTPKDIEKRRRRVRHAPHTEIAHCTKYRACTFATTQDTNTGYS